MFEQPQNPEPQNLNEVTAQYGRKIVEPGSEHRFDIEKTGIKGRGVEDVRFGIDILLAFVNLPIITDEFENHEERRSFRNKLSVTNLAHYNILESNKLRGNMISSVEQGFSILGEGIEDTNVLPSAKEEIKTLIATCPKYSSRSYDMLTIEEKVRYVQDLDKRIMRTIELLSGHQEENGEMRTQYNN